MSANISLSLHAVLISVSDLKQESLTNGSLATYGFVIFTISLMLFSAVTQQVLSFDVFT